MRIHSEEASEADRLGQLRDHHRALNGCRRCPAMFGPPVHGESVISPVLLIGQAPGTKEIEQGRPFCWTAGKTLFRWLASVGLDEHQVRSRVLMSAVCRCFPGKNPKGGDRVPDGPEVQSCSGWWRGELELSRPRLIIPVGKLAIAQFPDQLGRGAKLNDLVGQRWPFRSESGIEADLIPLPHPSGASTWFKMEPGKRLLPQALALIADHPAWRGLKD
jgi:uracil-DNA glycosylase